MTSTTNQNILRIFGIRPPGHRGVVRTHIVDVTALDEKRPPDLPLIVDMLDPLIDWLKTHELAGHES